MQRVRIGLTGLACVFLLVVLAASIFGFVGEAPPSAGAVGNGTLAAGGEDAPKDPLAELGVAPGNAPEHPVAEKQAVAPAPVRHSSRFRRQPAH